MELRGYDLRYTLTTMILDAGGVASTAELVMWLSLDGFTVRGRPSKTVADTLRSEINKGRVSRVGQGRYEIDRIPQSTRYRIVAHARDLHARASFSRCCDSLLSQQREKPESGDSRAR